MDSRQYFGTVMSEIKSDPQKRVEYYNKIYAMLNYDAAQLISEKNKHKIFYNGDKKYVPYADDIKNNNIVILGLCSKYKYLWGNDSFPFDELSKIFKIVNKKLYILMTVNIRLKLYLVRKYYLCACTINQI